MSNYNKIQEEYAQLLREMKYDEAFIDQLDRLCIKYAHELNKDLKTKIEAMKASILIKIGKHEAALRTLERVVVLIEPSGPGYFNVVYDLALTNLKLGHKKKAIAIIEEFLQLSFPKKEFFNLSMLKLMIEIKEEEEILLKYNKMINSLQVYLGVKESRVKNLSLQIKELDERNKASNISYSKLLLKIENLEQNDQVEELKKFITNEKELGFYKKMAEENLKHKSA